LTYNRSLSFKIDSTDCHAADAVEPLQ